MFLGCFENIANIELEKVEVLTALYFLMSECHMEI